MGRRMDDEGFALGAEKVWVALEVTQSRTLRPAAASLARTREGAKADLALATQAVVGSIVMAELPARHLVDFFPEVPIYCGREVGKEG